MSPRDVTEDDKPGIHVPRGDLVAWAAMDLADIPELEPEPFDVHRMIDAVARRFAAPAREKGISLEVRRAASVPRVALGEVEWLSEVLRALIGNAVRFTDAGEVVASITAGPTAGRRIVFQAEISDTGCGMSEKDLRLLFGPANGSRFTPLAGIDGTDTLGVAHRLVELMDGRLDGSSALGMGTTTCFSVPLDLPDKP